MKKSLIIAVLFVFTLAFAVPTYAVTAEPTKKEKTAEKKDKKDGCCKDKDKACTEKGEGKACCKKEAKGK